MACENLKMKKAVSFNVEVFDGDFLREIGTTMRQLVSRSDKSELTWCVAKIMATNVIVRVGFDFDMLDNFAATLLPLLVPDEILTSVMGQCRFHTRNDYLGAAVNENIRLILHRNFADWVVEESAAGTTIFFKVVK